MPRFGGTPLENATLNPPESEGPPESRGAQAEPAGFRLEARLCLRAGARRSAWTEGCRCNAQFS